LQSYLDALLCWWQVFTVFRIVLGISGFLHLGSLFAQTTNELDYIVEVSASAQVSPPQITLNWAQEYYAPSSILPGTVSGYDIFCREGDFHVPTLWRSTDSGTS
jgi:hypothetical protein